MAIAKNLTKIFKNESYRIFIIALFASFLWHLLWISTVKIVSNPVNAHAVKFSKVSFLGPLLGGGTMELQARPKERSFLEKRYFAQAKRFAREGYLSARTGLNYYETSDDTYHVKDDGMSGLISEVLSGEKIEPSGPGE
jgi:hypothetical protein